MQVWGRGFREMLPWQLLDSSIPAQEKEKWTSPMSKGPPPRDALLQAPHLPMAPAPQPAHSS